VEVAKECSFGALASSHKGEFRNQVSHRQNELDDNPIGHCRGVRSDGTNRSMTGVNWSAMLNNGFIGQ